MIFFSRETTGKTSRTTDQSTCSKVPIYLWFDVSHNTFKHTSNPECGRVLQARIGLISHLRTYEANHHRRRYGHHQKRWTSLDEQEKQAYINVRATTCSLLIHTCDRQVSLFAATVARHCNRRLQSINMLDGRLTRACVSVGSHDIGSVDSSSSSRLRIVSPTTD